MELKKFKDTRNNKTKNIIVSLVVIIVILSLFTIYRSYAIYKLEKKYDVMQAKIGSFTKGDLQVSVLVDGVETNTFPTYEDNYYVENINCTNNVTATFDVENWQINIADMNATSTKCTISFDSHKTNSVTPINMSKKQLLALNDTITNTAAAVILDKVYPVGAIYMSTEDDTVAKVQAKFGGTWEKYAEGKTLISANNEYPINTTGGSASEAYTPVGTVNPHTLTIDEIPSHAGHFESVGGTYEAYINSNTTNIFTKYENRQVGWTVIRSNEVVPYTVNYGGSQPHSHGFTGTQATISHMQPYQTTYMYKRVS